MGLGVGGGEELLMGTGVGAKRLDAFLKRPAPPHAPPPQVDDLLGPGFPVWKMGPGTLLTLVPRSLFYI